MRCGTVAVVLMVTGCLAACSDDGAGAEKFASDGTYTTSVASDPGNLNPLTALSVSTNRVVPFAYDRLIDIEDDGRLLPQLAQDWTVKPKRVVFTLRKGITCADGHELTAEDVAANFEWVRDPDNGSWYLGFALPDSNFDVAADNQARTVTLTLDKPYGFLLEGASRIPIVCPQGLEHPKLLAHDTYGTGPFVLSDYVADDHLTMTVRKDYRWGPGGVGSDEPGFPAQVQIKIVANPTTAVNLFLSGELNDVTPVGPDAARLKGQDYTTLSEASGPMELFFNQRDGKVTADPDVRRALSMALDLDSLTKVFTEGAGERATNLTPIEPHPCNAATTNGVLPPKDPKGAADLLDSAGWTLGADGVRHKDGRPLTIQVSHETQDQGTVSAMELVSQEWKDLGVDVHLHGEQENAFLKTVFGGTGWDATFLKVEISYPTQFVPFAAGPSSPTGQNFAALHNASYGELSDQAFKTPGDKGCALWGEAEQALFAAVDVVPISNESTITYASGAELGDGDPTDVRLLAR